MRAILRKRKKVFISSTSVDLADWRENLGKVLKESGLEVLSMEEFPAMGKGAVLGSSDMVSRCDLLVGIYARRYGTLSEDGRSITEHEYDEAKVRKLPRLCFMLRDEAEWPTELTDGEPGSSALQKFKQKIRGDVIVAEFSNLEELKAGVKSAADEYLQREKRRRRIRVAFFLLSIVALTVASLTIKPTVRPEATTQTLALSHEWVMSRDHQLVVFQGENSAIWPVERAFDQRVQLPNKIFDPVISPNSNYIAGHTGDGDVYVYRRDQDYSNPVKPVLKGLKLGDFNHEWCVFSPDERWVALSSADGRFYVWEVTKGDPEGLQPFLNIKITNNSVYSISPDILFSKTGRWLGVVDDAGTVYLERLGEGMNPTKAGVFKSVEDPEGDALRPRIWFSEDEQWVAASGKDGALAVWKMGERPPAQQTPQPRPASLWADRGEFTKDSKWIIVRPPHKGFYMRSVTSPVDLPGLSIGNPAGDKGDVGGQVLWLSPDGQWAAGVNPERNLYVWRVADAGSQSGVSAKQVMNGEWPDNVFFSPNGDWMAVITESGGLYVWQPENLPEIQNPSIKYSDHWNTEFAWCKDNRHFFTYGDQNLYLGELGNKPELVHHDADRIKAITVPLNGSALIVFTLRERVGYSRRDESEAPKFNRTLYLSHITRKLYLWGVAVKTLSWPQIADKDFPQ